MTIIIGTTSTGLDHRTSQIRTNLEIGEETMTIYDHLQRLDKNHPSRISAINPDRNRLIPQYSTGLGIETRVTIYLTTRTSQLPTMAISQTWFNLLQQTIK